MKGRLTFLVAAVAILLCWTDPAAAEMDDRSYTPHRPPMAQDEIERVRRQIDEEAAAETRRAEEKARMDDEIARRLAAMREARPIGERLLEVRCRVCHGSENFENARFGWLGWHATILRMRLINSAKLGWDEHVLIAEQLLKTRPATRFQQIIEWVIAVACLAGIAGIVIGLRRWWSR